MCRKTVSGVSGRILSVALRHAGNQENHWRRTCKELDLSMCAGKLYQTGHAYWAVFPLTKTFPGSQVEVNVFLGSCGVLNVLRAKRFCVRLLQYCYLSFAVLF
jgi:hypothetical protein